VWSGKSSKGRDEGKRRIQRHGGGFNGSTDMAVISAALSIATTSVAAMACTCKDFVGVLILCLTDCKHRRALIKDLGLIDKSSTQFRHTGL
jgi:hypothetical protein